MNLSIIILISYEIRRNNRSIEHILVIVIPHNTCTLPYIQRQKVTYSHSIEMVTFYNCTFQKQYCFIKSQETNKHTLLQNGMKFTLFESG